MGREGRNCARMDGERRQSNGRPIYYDGDRVDEKGKMERREKERIHIGRERDPSERKGGMKKKGRGGRREKTVK